MSETHIVGEICSIVEDHFPNNQAKIWFSVPVVKRFRSYEKRCELSNALKEEINNIPSDYVPYGTFFFSGLVFVYCFARVEETNQYLAEIDLASEVKHLGKISIPKDIEQMLEETELVNTSIH